MGRSTKLDGAAVPVQFLNEQDLVHVLAGQSIRRGHHHAVEFGQRGPVTQLVESRTIQVESSRAGRLKLAP